ncbi:histone deacetylase (nucleomorph) [Cryptomonas paramecium]|uniref:histone deacetylase n=1 Tax=Cryptomonas paramaecium TaxID=2898 RepID=F2HHA5_9CRYP|nr:histone deacetylase [Cryptomonas paramecium]AEA38701.1 histone deacetylase [Cryptomonas paramecium]|mmetsp:Transcript_53478/g.141809  ORF Transcript_53478/g.141809 Transcript_53478/m.141809 type:complete len:371 (-) Transcript_53478:287-1399(-)
MVSYFFDSNFKYFLYGKKHPMKPIRIEMTHELIFSYGLHKFLKFKFLKKINKRYLLNFHQPRVMQELSYAKDRNFFFETKESKHSKNMRFSGDCPIFLGITEYCELYTTASIFAGLDIVKKNTKISINWAGGLHHAKRSRMSGFCYTNDIILLLLELLKYFSKILYIDIDVHHGDGVEEAFYLSNRVFFISFHSYFKNYFPGTGNLADTGIDKGKFYSVNVPLKPGIDDNSFELLFKSIIKEAVCRFSPDVIVFQSGADSLSGDKLGVFNLSIHVHNKCIDFVKCFNLPLIILGGGGYTKKNVIDCWTLETSVLVNKKICINIPCNFYWKNFCFDKKRLNSIKRIKNQNSKKYLDYIEKKIMSNFMKIKN